MSSSLLLNKSCLPSPRGESNVVYSLTATTRSLDLRLCEKSDGLRTDRPVFRTSVRALRHFSLLEPREGPMQSPTRWSLETFSESWNLSHTHTDVHSCLLSMWNMSGHVPPRRLHFLVPWFSGSQLFRSLGRQLGRKKSDLNNGIIILIK